jgi:hypothetical protein
VNQIEKEKAKLEKELLSKSNKAIKNKTYRFKYVEKNNSEGFIDVFDTVVNNINDNVSTNGFLLEYIRESKRSETTHFNFYTVYTVSVNLATDTDKLLAKTNRAKARDGDEIKW